jgi:hypothetical protein
VCTDTWGGYFPARITECTFFGNSAGTAGGILHMTLDDSLIVENTIVSFSSQGEGVDGWLIGLRCSDIYGNQGGDWVGGIEDQFGVNGNISEDPLFCDPENDDFTLEDCSPCAPFSPPNPGCDLIGAWPIGCGGTPVAKTTWGALKALFRR